MTAPGFDVTVARAHCDAATPGPWSIEWDSDDAEYVVSEPFPYAIRMTAAPKVGAQQWADQYRDGKLVSYDFNRTDLSEFSNADAEFIAYARTALPAALDLIEAQQAEIERLQRETADAKHELALHKRDHSGVFSPAYVSACEQRNAAWRRRDVLQAALDRVAALCDEQERKGDRQIGYDGTALLPVVYIASLRSALSVPPVPEEQR